MTQASIQMSHGSYDVAKRSAPPTTEQPSGGGRGKQIAFRVDDRQYAEVERVASGLGLDISSFMRMMTTRCVRIYARELERIERGEDMDS